MIDSERVRGRKRYKRRIPMTSWLLIAVSSSAFAQERDLPLRHMPAPTSAAITVQDLMTRLYIIADDSMLGRKPGTIGEVRATRYVASELRRLGVEPGGDSGSYFQRVPLVMRVPDTKSRLTVENGVVVPERDFVLLPQRGGFVPQGSPRALDGAQVIFGGPLSDPHSRLTVDQVRGRIVVMTVPPAADRQEFRFWTKPVGSVFTAAAAIAVVSLDMTPRRLIDNFTQPRTSLPLSRAVRRIAVPLVLLVSDSAARLLVGASLDGLAVGTLGRVVHGTTGFVDRPTQFSARNVVGIIRGSERRAAREFIAVTAHIDHLGTSLVAVDSDSLHAFKLALEAIVPGAADGAPVSAAQLASVRIDIDSLRRLRPLRLDSIYNGAEDDASGSAALLEVAEALVQSRAAYRRSILFVWHTGEEAGLLGAKWYVEHPTVPRTSIVADVNVDGFGRWSRADSVASRWPRLQVVGARRLSAELGDVLERVNEASPSPVLFDYSWDAPGHPTQAYCRADHYQYARFGIPSVFLTDPLQPDYHAVTDEPQYINYLGTQRATMFLYDLIRALATAERPPRRDKPAGDPDAPCVQ